MSNEKKPLTEKDLVVGKKYMPLRKTAGSHINSWKSIYSYNDGEPIIYSGRYRDIHNFTYQGRELIFNPSDVIPYEELESPDKELTEMCMALSESSLAKAWDEEPKESAVNIASKLFDGGKSLGDKETEVLNRAFNKNISETPTSLNKESPAPVEQGEAKGEALDEAAENFATDENIESLDSEFDIMVHSFKAGAKWAKELMHDVYDTNVGDIPKSVESQGEAKGEKQMRIDIGNIIAENVQYSPQAQSLVIFGAIDKIIQYFKREDSPAPADCEDLEKRDEVAYIEGYNTALGRPSVPYNHLDKRSPFKQWWDKTYKGKERKSDAPGLRWVQAELTDLVDMGRKHWRISNSKEPITAGEAYNSIKSGSDTVEYLAESPTPTKDSEAVNQEKLWLEVKEIFARHYEAYNYPMQAIKECKTKFSINHINQ